MATALTNVPTVQLIPRGEIVENPFSIRIYGETTSAPDDLVESIRAHGILVPLVVAGEAGSWGLISGHRRLACAHALGLPEVPCEVRKFRSQAAKQRAILEYNCQRRKTFSQYMREADALEELEAEASRQRRFGNLRQFQARPPELTDRRNADSRRGRTDTAVARALNFGGKDLYRQARAIWATAQSGDPRAQASVVQLDAGTKTIHAAYKDLRRRDRFSAGFRPTPYDVWAFKHDRAFGIPHPGAIAPAIVAHVLHYYTAPDALVVDPMAGGGTTIDVCQSMGRRCLAYDSQPVRADVRKHDVKEGFPPETHGCDLVFCDPPYHTMLAHRYEKGGIAAAPLTEWMDFLQQLGRHAFDVLRPGGIAAVLLANQTEKDLPAGFGYLDHAFYGYAALVAAGFLPERRISCPMDGAYLPQHVRRARAEGRMLGQVRDLLVVRKPFNDRNLSQRIAARQLINLGADEGVREGWVAPDDRLRQGSNSALD